MFKDFRPEVVDHHAAQSNVPASVTDPVYDASVNVLGGLNLLKQSAAHGVRKFIYISSGGAMYGEPDHDSLPVAETAPVQPLSPYGASKQALEAWLGVYQRTFGLDYTVLRYANIYGPRQGIREEGAVVAVFATRMAADQPVTIDGSGQQTRDFVYVGDCVTANLAALERGSGDRLGVVAPSGSSSTVTRNRTWRTIPRTAGLSGRIDVLPMPVQAQRADRRPVAVDVADRALGLGDLEATGHRPPPGWRRPAGRGPPGGA